MGTAFVIKRTTQRLLAGKRVEVVQTQWLEKRRRRLPISILHLNWPLQLPHRLHWLHGKDCIDADDADLVAPSAESCQNCSETHEYEFWKPTAIAITMGLNPVPDQLDSCILIA